MFRYRLRRVWSGHRRVDLLLLLRDGRLGNKGVRPLRLLLVRLLISLLLDR